MLVIIDYKMGNLGSIANILGRLRVQARISSDPHEIAEADSLILPGVGAFDHGMRSLRELGLEAILRERVIEKGVPLLGICLGMQLLTEGSEEGNLPGLGWIKAVTRKFDAAKFARNLKIPHMGWNFTEFPRAHALFQNSERARFYFVHSYHVCCADETAVIARTHYGYPFTAAVARENVLGVQFHPEKSHRYGMQLLSNFVRFCQDVSSPGDSLPAADFRKAG